MLNQSRSDSLMHGPLLSPDDTDFLLLPDYLHPLAVETLSKDDFVPEIGPNLRDAALTTLDGTRTLKELGARHGQPMLDLIGTLHKADIVQFV